MRQLALAVFVCLGPSASVIAQAEPQQPPAAEPDLAYGETSAQRARGLFEQGRRAFEEGRFTQALEDFEGAYSLSGRPELLYDVGLAADRLREDARALEAFEGYLAATEASAEVAGQRAQVESRVAALKVARERRREEAKRAASQPLSASMAAGSNAPRESRADSGGVHTRWWFWTGIVLVVAGGVTAAVLLTRSDDDDDLPDPNTGVVVPTLRWSGP
jgi:tetratricopeptide (TPR) repeat protein